MAKVPFTTAARLVQGLAPYNLHVQRFERLMAALLLCSRAHVAGMLSGDILTEGSLLREHFGRFQSLQRFHSEARAKPCAMVPVRRSPGLHGHVLPGTPCLCCPPFWSLQTDHVYEGRRVSLRWCIS